MSQHLREISATLSIASQRKLGGDGGKYSAPWYLVLGEPGSGRSTLIRSMNLTWPQGDGTVKTSGEPMCTYWVPDECVFIEPGQSVLGPRRGAGELEALCKGFLAKRPREPIDGIILVISVDQFADLDENNIEEYGKTLRTYLLEVGRFLETDIPVYAAVTRCDNLWGFGDVFQWSAQRAKEEPWGFLIPFETQSQKALETIKEHLNGLHARFEAYCLARLCSEDPPEIRMRAFQHLVEVRLMFEKLHVIMKVINTPNAYERAPWLRALAIGSAKPGTGSRLRAGVQRFQNMGLGQPPLDASARPGGMPMHGYVRDIVLKEKDLVPTRTRWRDDGLTMVGIIVGSLLLVASIVLRYAL